MSIRTVQRDIQQVIKGQPTSDGAGVKLIRSIGGARGLRVDPFLMLDEFGTDKAADYIAGFPSHPHRGFETVTYMLDGHSLHQDHLGNQGDLKSGDVQWMTAGRGVIHSEMPQQTEGRMRGFQLWVNLPAAEKMKPAAYRDINADEIPVVALARGGQVKVIAGALDIDGAITHGPINTPDVPLTTDPLYLDVHLPADAVFEQAVVPGHNAFAYVYEGSASVQGSELPRHSAGVFADGDSVRFEAGSEGVRLLLVAGKPLNEPIAQYGPFVMNTMEEVEQAIHDYQNGTLTEAA